MLPVVLMRQKSSTKEQHSCQEQGDFYHSYSCLYSHSLFKRLIQSLGAVSMQNGIHQLMELH